MAVFFSVGAILKRFKTMARKIVPVFNESDAK